MCNVSCRFTFNYDDSISVWFLFFSLLSLVFFQFCPLVHIGKTFQIPCGLAFISIFVLLFVFFSFSFFLSTFFQLSLNNSFDFICHLILTFQSVYIVRNRCRPHSQQISSTVQCCCICCDDE